jgi:hypothetical protein
LLFAAIGLVGNALATPWQRLPAPCPPSCPLCAPVRCQRAVMASVNIQSRKMEQPSWGRGGNQGLVMVEGSGRLQLPPGVDILA